MGHNHIGLENVTDPVLRIGNFFMLIRIRLSCLDPNPDPDSVLKLDQVGTGN
jgi:hypothetical protein